jgi:hypothetical protein
MAIRSGIGIGEAQVFDTSGLANQYARQVAADQANLRKQAIENQKRNDEWLKDLAGTVSSTKLLGNGLHPKDVSKLTDYRAETLALYNKASQATNPQEKALLKAEVDKSIQQELEYVNGAKFFRQSGGELFNEILKNPWDYDDNVRNTVKDVLSNSYIDAVQQGYGALDKTSFKSNPDGTELNKSLDNVHKYVDKAAYLNTPAIRTTTVGQNKDYTVIGSTAKESDVFDYNKSLIEANNRLRYDVKSDWKIRNPDAQTDPTDNDLAIHLTNLYKEKYGPQAFKAQGSPQKITAGPKAPQSEIDKSKLIKDRTESINLLLKNKDQGTLESFKGSLPAGARVNWIPKDKSKVTGNKTDPSNIIGVYIKVPRSYNEYGEVISEINQQVFFDKGDPYKSINTIMNKYYGKKLSNEDLQKAGVGGNLESNKTKGAKPSIPSAKPVKFSAVQESAIAKGMEDNPGVPRAAIIKALGLQ